MSLTYIPNQRSPWEQRLPGFLQSLVFNQMAAKRQEARFERSQKAKEAEEVRDYKAEGWREPEAQKPVIDIGGTGLVPPESGLEIRTIGGQQMLVQTRTPYGGKKRDISGKVIKRDKPGKVEVYNPQKGLTDIYPTYTVGGKTVRGEKPIGSKAAVETPATKRAESLKKSKALSDYNQNLKKQMVDYKKREGAPDAMTPGQQRVQDESLVKMAMTIEAAPETDAAIEAARYYNKKAKGNSVYYLKKTERTLLADKKEVVRVELPVVAGAQVTAEEIRDTLKKHAGLTLDQLLKQLKAIE